MNPFLPLIKQIIKQYNIEVKEPKTKSEKLAQKVLDVIWDDIEPAQLEEYEVFYPTIQIMLFGLCNSDKRVKKIAVIFNNYLKGEKND